ncbi:hypothetical protein B0H16DRAFT_1523238 [Mycena metata]|uniref:Uncharacterized protein n=1 Tax=Mycena metata TaxID=1033252 RepID=A0AAD7NKZ2_9AGAR|nr:hypothetical protein B0H16DRAFT_1523238 [Mycena metata]
MLEKAPTHTGRKRPRICSKGTLVVLANTALVLFILSEPAFALIRLLTRTRFYQFPNRAFFVNETDIALVSNRSDVVQPLIGANDTFDIAVTVWQLATSHEKQEEYRRQREKSRAKNVSEEASDLTSKADKLRVSYARWYNMVTALEKTIFSDIVFRGLRLSDPDAYVNVTLQIPTQIFHANPGNNNDLRASFMILPHSPGPFDYFKNYTSSIPDGVNRPRFRSLPFPQNSPTEFHRTLQDVALDSFAFTIPLIERHSVASMCPVGDYDHTAEDEEILHKHPHIITRTHLRIVRETRLFRRDLYLQRHENMRNISCRKSIDEPPHLNYCRRLYRFNGNWETMLQLAVPDPDAEGGFREESAYAPFMDVLHSAPGPKDILPVPIVRERCAREGGHERNLENRPLAGKCSDTYYLYSRRICKDHMNITWRLSVASVSPRNYLLGEIKLTPLQRSNHTDSEYVRAMKQDVAETFASLHGHRHREDSHPRRRLARLALAILSMVLLFALNCTYWVARTSTTGISVPGSALAIASDLLSLAAALYHGLGQPVEGADALVALTLQFHRLEPLFRLKAISRLRVFRTGLILRAKWVPATHQERASARLDARTDWRWKCGILAALLLAFYSANLESRMLVPAAAPRTVVGDFPGQYSSGTSAVVQALDMTGAIFQLILNYRGRVFAGRYKASVVVGVVAVALGHAGSVAWLVGRSEVMSGISYAEVLWDVVAAVTCWQAWRYSSRIPEDEHGDEES